MTIIGNGDFIFLSEVPNLIQEQPDSLKITFSKEKTVLHAKHTTQNCLFWFEQKPDNHARFIIFQDNYRLEYHTWCNSPYLIKHNSLEFWNIHPDDQIRLQKFAAEVVELINEKASQILTGLLFTFFLQFVESLICTLQFEKLFDIEFESL